MAVSCLPSGAADGFSQLKGSASACWVGDSIESSFLPLISSQQSPGVTQNSGPPLMGKQVVMVTSVLITSYLEPHLHYNRSILLYR